MRPRKRYHNYFIKSLIQKNLYLVIILLSILIHFSGNILKHKHLVLFQKIKSNCNFFYPIIKTQSFIYSVEKCIDFWYSIPFICKNNTIIQMLQTENRLISIENRNLKTYLHYYDSDAYSSISTKITIKNGMILNKEYTVNVGTNHNIKVGNIMIAQHKVIGQVIKVENNYSYVQLIGDRNFQILVDIPESNIQAIAINKYGNRIMRILYPNKYQAVDDNLLVVTSGENNIVPKGLYIGKTINKNGELFLETEHTIYYDTVSIIKSKNGLK